jgi:membrane associated rhomboid family serine protease
MFLPFKDDEPLHVIRFQYVTVAIIVLNVALFLLTGPLAGAEAAVTWATGFGVVPTELLAGARNASAALNPVAEPLTLITYMFLHGGWIHLISNMAFIWVFADNIEDAFGAIGFAVFYLVSGVAGALLHVAMSPDSNAPLIGASGAASGVIAAYLLLYPRARVWVLLFMRIPVRFQAIWVLGGWALLQVVSLFMEQAEGQAVAWWAHIGGFIAGLILTLLLRKRLFQSAL